MSISHLRSRRCQQRGPDLHHAVSGSCRIGFLRRLLLTWTSHVTLFVELEKIRPAPSNGRWLTFYPTTSASSLSQHFTSPHMSWSCRYGRVRSVGLLRYLHTPHRARGIFGPWRRSGATYTAVYRLARGYFRTYAGYFCTSLYSSFIAPENCRQPRRSVPVCRGVLLARLGLCTINAG